MPRIAAKVDSNQGEIVRFLRSIGASVASIATVGTGVPDLIVGYRGVNYLVEVKDGSKPPSQRRLTPAEEKFHAEWRGTVHIVNDTDGAYDMLFAPFITENKGETK